MLCCKIRILFQPKGSTFTETNTLVYGPVEPCFNKWLRFLIWGDMLFSYDVKFQGSKFNPYQSIQNLWWNQPSLKGSNLIHKLVGSCHVTKNMYIYIYAYKYFFAVWQKKRCTLRILFVCHVFVVVFFLCNELKHPRLPWRWLTMQTKQMEPNGLESAASTRDGAVFFTHKNWVVATQRLFLFTLSWGKWSNFD